MPKLIALQGKTECINVPQKIGVKWSMVGTLLLDDSDGSIVEAIEREHRDNAFEISRIILARWLQGQGTVQRTWRGLTDVLRKVDCGALAESMEEALMAEEEITDSETDKPIPLPRSSIPKRPQQPHPPMPLPRTLIGKRPQQPHPPVPRKRQRLHPPATEKAEDSATPTTKPSPQQRTPPPEATATTSTPQHELSPPPTEQQFKPSSPSPTDPPKQPPPPPPTCPPLNPQSAECHFAEYLKCIYNRPIDTVDTWPPSPSRKYINLAIITREKIETREQQEQLHRFMLASLHGDIDEILETKAPVTLEALLDPEPGKDLACVLVEGAPGVGKTTLSREICKNWAEGKLFQQYSLVLLLRLRDATVQAAGTVADLVQYMAEDWVEDVSRYLKDTRGKHTLIILEGLDELPRHLISQASIFTRLLAGSALRDATIMITSRPSATAQLWKNWKARITRHIEILGFSEENITEYVASVLNKKEVPAFNNYLCTAPSIRQMMYIPLHSGIIIEIYRMCSRSEKSLPTNKTALYKVLVRTILTRYLANHSTYKDDEIDVEQFTDLPSDIHYLFNELIELAYNGIMEQQLIFRDRESEIQHLGFMDVVTELYALERKAKYSYNFLHLSIQEFLGAYYVSLMDTGKQESLLEAMCTQTHLRNMALFLAGLTKFTDLNRSIVKMAIRSTCKEEGRELTLSEYAVKILYETNCASLLEGNRYYRYNLTKFTPSFVYTALGNCVSRSNFAWRLRLGGTTYTTGDTSQYMQSAERVQLLARALSTEQTPSYSIDMLEFYHVQPDADGCLPALLPTMNQLRRLTLWHAPLDITVRTLQAVAAARVTTLEVVDLRWLQFGPQAVPAFHDVLTNCRHCISEVWLAECNIDNEGALCLSRALRQLKLSKLTDLDLQRNVISDTGALAIANAVQSATAGLGVKAVWLYKNSISREGKEKLYEFKEENKAEWLAF